MRRLAVAAPLQPHAVAPPPPQRPSHPPRAPRTPRGSALSCRLDDTSHTRLTLKRQPTDAPPFNNTPCPSIIRDNKFGYICPQAQMEELHRRLDVVFPRGCPNVQRLSDLLAAQQQRAPHRHLELCFVGDSQMWQTFDGLECQLEATGLITKRTVPLSVSGWCGKTAANPDVRSAYHCPQPAAIHVHAKGLSARFTYMGIAEGENGERMAPPLCLTSRPFTPRHLSQYCGEKPPDALLLNTGAAHCVLHRHYNGSGLPAPPLTASMVHQALRNADAAVREYMSGRPAWLQTTYQTPMARRFRWAQFGDVEADFVKALQRSPSGSGLRLLDLRGITSSAPDTALSDGLHFCCPGVSEAVLNAWATALLT